MPTPEGLLPDIQKRFEYHPPKDEETVQLHENIRGLVRQVAELFAVLLPYSREQSTAITKLEEAMMWANAAVARHS